MMSVALAEIAEKDKYSMSLFHPLKSSMTEVPSLFHAFGAHIMSRSKKDNIIISPNESDLWSSEWSDLMLKARRKAEENNGNPWLASDLAKTEDLLVTAMLERLCQMDSMLYGLGRNEEQKMRDAEDTLSAIFDMSAEISDAAAVTEPLFWEKNRNCMRSLKKAVTRHREGKGCAARAFVVEDGYSSNSSEFPDEDLGESLVVLSFCIYCKWLTLKASSLDPRRLVIRRQNSCGTTSRM